LALIAASWAAAGRLAGNGVVGTIMSNLGLDRFLAKAGLTLHRTQVGDRYVAERMRETGLNIGGEQSGHIILADYATTGDGLIAALQVLAAVVDKQRPVSEVCRMFSPLPQQMRNIRFAGVSPLRSPSVKRAIAEAEMELGGSGRLVVRQSGTESVIRIMVECEAAARLQSVMDSLCVNMVEIAGAY
jgi:phosphoglucosamine mutase